MQKRTPNMTAREAAIYNEQKRRKAIEKRKKRAYYYALTVRISVLTLIAVLLFIIILVSSLASDFSKSPDKYSYSLEAVMNGEEKKMSKDISERNNICYVSLDSVCKLLGARMMGDVNIMSMVFENGDKISFYIDTKEYSVNGLARTMNAASYFSGKDGDVYVPVEVFSTNFEGIELSGVKKGSSVAYTLDITSDFKLDYSDNSYSERPVVTEMTDTATQISGMITDLTDYIQYIEPEIRDEYITLINADHPLGADYVPGDLINISFTRNDRKAQQMREYAAKALDAMFLEMKANGFTDVSVTSGYRTYTYQKQLFDNSVSRYTKTMGYDAAYAKTLEELAIPGSSEHQSGLCADLHNLSSASTAFEAQAAYKWLYANCAEFGFILRYPKDKTHITGISFEPWHYRYVGRYHAKKIMESGLCLEEYCELNGIGY